MNKYLWLRTLCGVIAVISGFATFAGLLSLLFSNNAILLLISLVVFGVSITAWYKAKEPDCDDDEVLSHEDIVATISRYSLYGRLQLYCGVATGAVVAFGVVNMILGGFRMPIIWYVFIVATLAFIVISLIKYRYNDTLESLFPSYDDHVDVKSKQSVLNYNADKYFSDAFKITEAGPRLIKKKQYVYIFKSILEENTAMPTGVRSKMQDFIDNADKLVVQVSYVSPAGRSSSSAKLLIPKDNVEYWVDILNQRQQHNAEREAARYARANKQSAKDALQDKRQKYYDRVNKIIDKANQDKSILTKKSDIEELDRLIGNLIDQAIKNVKKIKSADSNEWQLLDTVIKQTQKDINKIVDLRHQILDYYYSDEFKQLKATCDGLMSKQKEFNEYIDEKAKSIASLFGTNVARSETQFDDEYNYIHPYKKSITPFCAEVSAAVFASAENSPLEYVVKHFYSDKSKYPEQIQKLQLLVEELETLKEAKQIIEHYKQDIQQYLSNVPDYVIGNDPDGFYARLGFAIITEETLTVEYKFSYTSNSGRAQRSFTVPMTEETIVQLIEMLESKLTMAAFSKEQRQLMTAKLREYIKSRDNYTCKFCGNSTHKEPNLLLEVDHIIPVAKGGYTQEDNLQTLCWKCNRSKGSKVTS